MNINADPGHKSSEHLAHFSHPSPEHLDAAPRWTTLDDPNWSGHLEFKKFEAPRPSAGESSGELNAGRAIN